MSDTLNYVVCSYMNIRACECHFIRTESDNHVTQCKQIK